MNNAEAFYYCKFEDRSGTVVLLVNRIDISGLVAELGPILKHLAIHASAVNVPLASLRDAHSLEILELDARPKHSESWPQCPLCILSAVTVPAQAAHRATGLQIPSP
ncbi:hypothetical protein FOCC_FOCC011420 [Frankliniella occidentalis]|nr:hypothetical protein FOCC_FOCC011420 [Frankliniella occidentalis]